jgi:Fe2+ or Zn2+ uptake regulation protein
MNLLESAEDRELAALLRRRGGRVTPQRLVIARALRGRARHVTAEGLLRELGDHLPGLSLPTVYATLALFEKLGLVRRVAVPGEAIAYDTRLEPHGHAVCRSCGDVRDLDSPAAPAAALGAAAEQGYRPERAEVIVTGLCPLCAHREDEPAV